MTAAPPEPAQGVASISSCVYNLTNTIIGSGVLALEQPRRIDLRPWGATATILEQQAQRLGVVLPKPLACAALGAIVSQTKGLESARTTAQDRQSAARLARRAGIQQAQLLTTFDLEER